MIYPTLEQVQAASHYQLAEWSRFLPSANDEQRPAQDLIFKRFHEEFGGWTPALSKSIGWDR